MQHIRQLVKSLPGQFDFNTFFFARRLVSQLKYLLYPVRTQVPAFTHYWLLNDADVIAAEPAHAHPDSGITRHDIHAHRCAYTSYVPESYDPSRAWPIIVSMHGGSGNDEDFLWTWLKYAKSRGYLLISGKSFGPTWHPWDAPSVLLMLDDMQARGTRPGVRRAAAPTARRRMQAALRAHASRRPHMAPRSRLYE